ncbi:MAG: rod shape-determining protein MreD [Hydrogenophilaceae bacterium]
MPLNTEKPLVPQGPQLIAPAPRRLVYASLVLGYLCILLPWPQGMLWLVPDFTLVVLLYWVIHAPHLAGLGLAMALGLLTDATLGGLMGQHALTYTVTAFLVIHLRRRLENFEVSGRALHLAPIFLGQQALFLILGLVFRLPDADWRYLVAGLSAVLCWIPLARLFDRLTGWTNEMHIEPAAK